MWDPYWLASGSDTNALVRIARRNGRRRKKDKDSCRQSQECGGRRVRWQRYCTCGLGGDMGDSRMQEAGRPADRLSPYLRTDTQTHRHTDTQTHVTEQPSTARADGRFLL